MTPYSKIMKSEDAHGKTVVLASNRPLGDPSGS